MRHSGLLCQRPHQWLPRLRVYRHNLEEYFFNERMRGEVAHRVMEHILVSGDDADDTQRAIRLAMADFPALGSLSARDSLTVRPTWLATCWRSFLMIAPSSCPTLRDQCSLSESITFSSRGRSSLSETSLVYLGLVLSI